MLELYGIDRARLKAWMHEGLKATGKRHVNGGRTYVFDPIKLAAWCGAHGKNPKGIQGNTFKTAGAAQDPPAAVPTDKAKPEELINQYGLLGYLERVRKQERFMNMQFVRAVQTDAPSNEVANLSRALTIKGEELRRLEMVALEYQKQTGALCNFAEMQRIFHDLASGTRERIMAVPNELAPVLREYLRDPDDTGKVHDEIKQAIVHALSALPDELPDKKKT